jgi:Na(+)-translocating NADH:ubiquinone oxidoreductase F subunit
VTHETEVIASAEARPDYSLTGLNASLAIEKGLAEADWYQSPIPRETMRKLLERRDGPAIRDTLLWFFLLGGSGYGTYLLWGTWWVILPYAIYAVLYSQTSDSRWHETGHGTAFRTDWMNNVVYEVASFMVKREATVWRWSHTRHHSDTIIVGRDPEISIPRPPDIKGLILGLLCLNPSYPKRIAMHCFGRMASDERVFIPPSEFTKVFWRARIYALIYVGSLALSLAAHSAIPLFLVWLPNLFGTWLLYVYNLTQHAGLAENVLDHRLNCRTVYMNPVNRYLYWNMNYHLEHHMFPLVPYHALPRLHEAVKNDMPPPYPSIYAAWREILPAVRQQMKDSTYYVRRRLPQPQSRLREGYPSSNAEPNADGWIEICGATELGLEDVVRFDHRKKTYALYRDERGELFATDGVCTHGNTHLADGLVKGKVIECPKHNGRFNLSDGSPARAPICRGLVTYPLEERQERLFLNILRAGGAAVRHQKTYTFRVASNRNVATFIKELILEPVDAGQQVDFEPGDYLQLDIPTFETIRFREFDIGDPYIAAWANNHLFDLEARNPESGRRNNYSIASNKKLEGFLRFNVRIATPPPGQECCPGIGSSYVFSLRAGDIVTAIGPFGDFHIRPTQREMIYVGGGAGMAPLRAHLSHLFETEKTLRKVSFWYGARSRQEIFYEDYFRRLAERHANFSFHVALSAPLPEDQWAGLNGFIHEVLLANYLRQHATPKAVEFYLCGPPMMIRACTRMLSGLGVPDNRIAFDEF